MDRPVSGQAILLLAFILAIAAIAVGGVKLLQPPQASVTVDASESSPAGTVNVSQASLPAHLFLTANGSLVADGNDNLTLAVKATDANGLPVPDGTQISLSVRQWAWYLGERGTLSTNASYQGLQALTLPTNNGEAVANFGWINESYPGTKATILASIVADPDVNGSEVVYAYRGIMWAGKVMNSYGDPLDNTTVTLHLIGTDAAGNDREIYDQTIVNPSEPEHPGSYIFDNLTMPGGVTYGYASACVEIGGGVVYYGRTQNASLTDPGAQKCVGEDIVLHVPIPGAMPIDAPGREP